MRTPDEAFVRVKERGGWVAYNAQLGDLVMVMGKPCEIIAMDREPTLSPGKATITLRHIDVE